MRRKKKPVAPEPVLEPAPLLTAADLAQISATQAAPEPELVVLRPGLVVEVEVPEAPDGPGKPPKPDDAMREAMKDAIKQAKRDGVKGDDDAGILAYTETAKRQVKVDEDAALDQCPHAQHAQKDATPDD